MKRLLVLVIGLIWVLQVIPAQAHDPHFETSDWGGLDNPFVVPTDPTVSFAMYGYLEDHDIDAIAMDFKNAGDKLQTQLLVAVCGKHYTEFYPKMAIVGPGLPVPSDPKALPFDLPNGLGAKIVEMDQADANGKRPTMYEDIGGTTFYTAPEVEMNVSQAARYYVVVWQMDGKMGDYAVATGYKETPYSPLSHTFASIAFIRSNHFLHRDCTKDPSDPKAVIQPDYSTVLDAGATPSSTVPATAQPTLAATAQAQ
jgi:hypothetical protein